MSEHEKVIFATVGLGAIAIVLGLTLYNYLGVLSFIGSIWLSRCERHQDRNVSIPYWHYELHCVCKTQLYYYVCCGQRYDDKIGCDENSKKNTEPCKHCITL